MDGRFVPQHHARPGRPPRHPLLDGKPLNVHLMIAGAGANHLLVQAEPGSTVHLHRVLTSVWALGKKAGVVPDPASRSSLSSTFCTSAAEDYQQAIANIRASVAAAAVEP